MSSWTDLGLWAAGGHPRRLKGPSPLLKQTWVQILAWPPSDPEPKSTTIWASVSLPVKWADCWREARGCVCCQGHGCPPEDAGPVLSPHPSFPAGCVPGQPGLGAVLEGQGPECLQQGGRPGQADAVPTTRLPPSEPCKEAWPCWLRLWLGAV